MRNTANAALKAQVVWELESGMLSDMDAYQLMLDIDAIYPDSEISDIADEMLKENKRVSSPRKHRFLAIFTTTVILHAITLCGLILASTTN